MYYPRYRAETREPLPEKRGRRTRSEDYHHKGSSTNNSNTNDPFDDNRSNLVEETLKEIRSRRPSGSTNISYIPKAPERDSQHLSCEEIDKLLNDIRSRSQSLSGRPPPPKKSPPPLPQENNHFDVGQTPFGNVHTSPTVRNFNPSYTPRSKHRNRPNMSDNSATGSSASGSSAHTSKTAKQDLGPNREMTSEEISELVKSLKKNSQKTEPVPSPRQREYGSKFSHPKAQNEPKSSREQKFSHTNTQTESKSSQEPKHTYETKLKQEPKSNSEPKLSGTNSESEKVWYNNPAYDAPKTKPTCEVAQPKDQSEHSAAAFETVKELKERLKSMSDDLERVKAAADRINNDLQKEMVDTEEIKPPPRKAKPKAESKDTFIKIQVNLKPKPKEETVKPDHIYKRDIRPESEHKEDQSFVINSQCETSSQNGLDNSSCDEDESEDDNSDGGSPVYNATVRTTHVCKPRPAPAACQATNRRPLSKIGRPESIYIDEIINSNLSLADQKKEEGNELYKISNYREALQRYSEAISLCPDTPSFYGNRAACYMMLAQYTRALEDAKTSVQLDNQFTKGYIRVAKCCIAMGDIVSANQALDTALRLEPNNSAVIQEKNSLQTLQKHQSDAETAYNNKDHRKALYCLDRALDIATASRQLKLLRAECLAYLGRYGEAQEVANDLLRQDSTNVDAIFVRGLCLYYEDNVDKAFTHFQQVLRFAPDHQRAKDAYKKAKLLRQKKEDGNNAFKNGKFSEAYDLYTEALAIDSCNKFTNAKLYFNRATVAARLKKLKESVDDCTSALSLDDKYVKAQLRRAKSYMELEMYDEAVRDYEALLRTDRGSQEYRHLLQQAKLELKKSKRKDYYKILGVERGASDEEIKRAYRKRALVHHPDRHSGSSDEEKKEHEKKFKEIGEAYGVLSDSKKRSRYDNGCDIDDLDGGGGHGGYGAEIDPDKIFQAFFGGGVPGGMHGGAHSFGFGGGPGQMPGGFSFQFG